jgi:hypothetical protein
MNGRDERDSDRERLERRARALRRTRLSAVNTWGVRISGGNIGELPQIS